MKLLRAVYRNGGARYRAERMGVAYPPDRTIAPEDSYTRPDLRRAADEAPARGSTTLNLAALTGPAPPGPSS